MRSLCSHYILDGRASTFQSQKEDLMSTKKRVAIIGAGHNALV